MIKIIISKNSIFFLPLLIEFFEFALLWFNLEKNMHTKVIVDVSTGGSFESCSAWEGANELPWGRKSLPG